MTAQTMIYQKNKPGPSSYKIKDEPRILGVYAGNADIVSHIESHQFVKKSIPGPDKYESSGKSMHRLSQERSDRNRYFYDKSHGLGRSDKIRKDNVAGPGTYKVPEALQNSASTRSSIKNSFTKNKNINYIRSLLAQKAKVPGVGHYATVDVNKQLSIPTTSMRVKRH